MGVDDVLPLNKIRYCETDVDSFSEFRKHIKNKLPFALPLLQTLDTETLSPMFLKSCKLREPEST